MHALAALPAPGLPDRRPGPLSRKAKAAIIVQLLLKEDADIPLSSLPEDMQADLTLALGNMRYIDRETLNTVVQEFVAELESVGLSFPGDMAGSLNALDGRISARTAMRLRKEAGVRQTGDPWQRINALNIDRLVGIVQSESIEIAAVMMSKIDVSKAAEVLAKLPGDRARRISYAVSMTTAVTPEAVDRIGLALAAQLDAEPLKAFKARPDERLGAILNYASSTKREEVLTSLDETDRDFADAVRKAIFTFANIPLRLKETDVPKILRDVPQEVVAVAIAAAESDDDRAAVDFIMANISKRMAASLREEADGLREIKPRAAERAMTQVVNAIRELVTSGEIELRKPDEDAD